jgi:D-methionine transport system substrate-binding protein
MLKKSLIFITIIILSAILLKGIIGHFFSKSPSKFLRVGVISGPEEELMKVAKKVAASRYRLSIQIKVFSDYNTPNAALQEGSLDANMFQHQAYLEEEMKHRNYQFSVIGRTFNYPSGIYSQKITQLSDLNHNALVAIANDPTNEGRALLLLEKAGLIRLDPQSGFLATPKSIRWNPKNLQFKELDAAQLTRVLPDVAIAVINTNYAIPANLYPNRDALFVEDAQAPYANLLVARRADQHNLQLRQLLQALQTPEVIAAAEELFQGQAVPAW